MESSGFSRLNLNESAGYFEPFGVPLLIQGALLSGHPPSLITLRAKNEKWIPARLQPGKKFTAASTAGPVLVTVATWHL